MKIITLILAVCLPYLSTAAFVEKELVETFISQGDTAHLYEKWTLKNVRSLTPGLHGLSHNLEILDLRIKGKFTTRRRKKGVNYKLEDNIIVFLDKRGRPLSSEKSEEINIYLRIASVESSRLVLIMATPLGDQFEMSYRPVEVQ
jgi:hypothetical protein